MADVSAGLQENHDTKATEVDEKGVALEVKPSMSSNTNETGDNSQNASSSSPLKHTQDTTPKKMEKTEKEKENKERGRPSSGSSSLTKTSPVKVANTDSRHEREEKVRLTRERQEEERRRKIDEFRESNQRAAQFRRKQEDDRQRKILEARQKELDRRMTVEERRKKLFQEENERKQAILRRTAERESKLNQHRSSSRQHAIFGFAATTAPIARRAKSSHSDNTLSSSEWSPMRRPRPHSVGGRLPSYASPTFSSQAHHGRSTDKKADGNQLVCHRFRSLSPVGKLRSKSADPSSARRSRADLRRTFERLAAPKMPSTKDTSTPSKATPIKDKTPVRSSARSLSSQRQGSARPSPVGSAANTVSKAKSTPPKMQPAVARTVTPSLKPSIPSISKNSKPTAKGPVKAVHIKVTTAQEKKLAPKKAPSPKETSPVKEKKPPGEDTTKTEDKTKQISEDDYKAKLAEKRRQAREKAERDAEEAKQREEQRIRDEEERKRKEEEEQRRLEEEELRLAEEARIAEADRLKKAIEVEETRKKEEEKRLEAEKKAKEEAERVAQEEAEKKEAERLVRMKREEEERIARKKKLEMIMKRVKVDDTSPKSETAANPAPVEEKVEGEDSPTTVPAPVAGVTSDEGGPKFKSALLQQMLGKKGRLGRSTEKLSDSSKSSSEEKEDDNEKKVEELEEGVPEEPFQKEQQPEVVQEQQLETQVQQPEIGQEQQLETEVQQLELGQEQQLEAEVQQPEIGQEQQLETEVQQPEIGQEQQQEVEQEQQLETEQVPQVEVEQEQRQEMEHDEQADLARQGEAVRRDETEYSEEKPVIQMNDIIAEDTGVQQVVGDIITEAAPVQSVESLQQENSIADSKDSRSEVGNGDLVENTDIVVSGNGEMSVSATTSSNSVYVSDQDSKESLRERLEQDKDIDTAEADGSVRSALRGGVDSGAVLRTETAPVSSAMCADPPDLLGSLDSAAVNDGHHDMNGFTRCDDNSDNMTQLDSKLDMRPNGSSTDHFEQVIDLGRIEGDKQLINLGLDMMTDGQTVPPSAPLIAFEENANKGLPDMMS